MRIIKHRFEQYKELFPQVILLKTAIKQLFQKILGDIVYKKIKQVFVDTLNGQKKYFYIPKQDFSLPSYNEKVSIIIPTYNAETYLPNLIHNIKNQKNIQKPEIVLVDSESQDNTVSIAKSLNLKIISIKQSTFNHGESRNMALPKTKGEYIIFMVQDALPKDQYLFAKMLRMFKLDSQLAAVSTRQCPCDDADIFAKWQSQYTYDAIGLENKDYIFYHPRNIDFDALPIIIKRKISLLDNVCCAIKKDVFINLGGFNTIPIAEDIDFAIRLVRNGYSIGFLGSSCITHSHTRTPLYFLKRYYIGSKTQLMLYREKVKSPFLSLYDVFTTFNQLYLDLFNTDELYYQVQTIAENLRIPSMKTDNSPNRLQKAIIRNELKLMYHEARKSTQKEALTKTHTDILKKKIVMALLGSHLAKYVIDYRFIDDKDRKKEHKQLDVLLAKNV